MSSPMIASCRPTCPMVLEEWEPGVPDTENVHPLSKGPLCPSIGGGTASPQRAVGPLEVCPKTFTREEKECLLDGFVESELKKLLIVQRESGLWKMGSHEGQELLTQPEITLEEAGIVDGQHLLLEEMDEMGNWPP
ncbi:uncharacterized protein LOC111098223 isoform X3 [Canis lupus familiaris]|uniref:uncharacterized protein LOC111098223 isoform X3 n=1 Tax=Canis lupus familiaris TaxID=9615 RepID=UPI000BAA0EA2|nr:uncharacterized protein LOC111098223 isoform X3 [Canis lupus familiaris]XP_038409681.1 uncharacterized protein LOC111098223 isoform X3 [Canis lupus familiaris]XP_038539143.1 uncharacterized protein LOC111098223 isoform X3 [Canis lupus familiaris]|eukprot:XP_022281650.1 uncharacterized protein LOC111098223 isoform X2 [Canis lupus familiaris]